MPVPEHIQAVPAVQIRKILSSNVSMQLSLNTPLTLLEKDFPRQNGADIENSGKK